MKSILLILIATSLSIGCAHTKKQMQSSNTKNEKMKRNTANFQKIEKTNSPISSYNFDKSKKKKTYSKKTAFNFNLSECIQPYKIDDGYAGTEYTAYQCRVDLTNLNYHILKGEFADRSNFFARQDTTLDSIKCQVSVSSNEIIIGYDHSVGGAKNVLNKEQSIAYIKNCLDSNDKVVRVYDGNYKIDNLTVLMWE